ncbi:MAG TPA: MFS transporter [Pseudolabrys sp.]|nr:MFS transporter [Pseudolabrys sp.]
MSIQADTTDHAPLESASMGRQEYWSWFLASGGTLIDGLSIFSLGVAMPLITSRFSLSAFMVGLIGSALVLGAVFGAVVGGPAADRFGRKPAFLIDMTIITAGALISALAGAPQWVLLGQFIVGVGIGIDFPVSSSYVSETAPKQARSRMVVATIALQSVGMLLGAAVAIAVLWQRSSSSDWRLIVGTTAAVSLLFLLLRLSLPESPRWLREHEVSKAAPGSAAPPRATTSLEAVTGSVTALPGPGFAVLFSRLYRKRTMLVSLPWFLMDVATYGVGLFTPVILGAIHSSSKTTGPLAAEFADAKGSAAIDLFLLFGFLVGLWAVPRFGRIHMQVIGFVGMTLGMLILVSAELAGGGAAAHVWLVFAGFILFNLAMNAGPNATTFALAPELFPTSVRASAGGFAAASAKVGATLGIFVLPQVKASGGVAAVLIMMAIVSSLGAVVTAMLAREVGEIPEGRSLEEVETNK